MASAKKCSLLPLMVCLLAVIRAEYIQIFDNSNFGGDQETMTLNRGQCHDVPGHFNDRISSINTHSNCINVYEHGGCGGRSALIAVGTGCHSYLGDCGLNDQVSSIRLC